MAHVSWAGNSCQPPDWLNDNISCKDFYSNVVLPELFGGRVLMAFECDSGFTAPTNQTPVLTPMSLTGIKIGGKHSENYNSAMPS